MANTKLLFLSCDDKKSLEAYHNSENTITFWISDNSGDCGIDIDKETAIKLVKTLKSEISKIKEVNNG